METSAFNFTLPETLIAQRPAEPRESARLMVVDRSQQAIKHLTIADLPDQLHAGDILARNDTRVIPARLIGVRSKTGGKWEGLFLRQGEAGTWEILATTRGSPEIGERFEVDSGLTLTLISRGEGGRWIVRPEAEGDTVSLLETHGRVPLPPYIRKGRDDASDRTSYQTVFAREPGAVAAPTAGLHFTRGLIERIEARGVGFVDLTLHVGIGTFRPIEAERIEDHILHAEWAELRPEAANRLIQARGEGGRIVAIGTTSCRTLETSARDGTIRPFAGETALYLRPGHTFNAVDALITNFHLPRSSLLVLVSALAGRELIREAYDQAIREKYRFYSYGDAMFIV